MCPLIGLYVCFNTAKWSVYPVICSWIYFMKMEKIYKIEFKDVGKIAAICETMTTFKLNFQLWEFVLIMHQLIFHNKMDYY